MQHQGVDDQVIETILDTLSFFLVTTDLYGQERLQRLGSNLLKLKPFLDRQRAELGLGTVKGLLPMLFAVAILPFSSVIAIFGTEAWLDLALSLFGLHHEELPTDALQLSILSAISRVFGHACGFWVFRLLELLLFGGILYYVWLFFIGSMFWAICSPLVWLVRLVSRFRFDGTLLLIGTLLFLIARCVSLVSA